MEWPWQYSFPPFFTLQINEDTKKKQLDAWCDLVLAYCKQTRLFQLDLIESQSSELFNNKKIDRKCSLELIAVIIDELVRRSRAEWIINSELVNSKSSSSSNNTKTKSKAFILWHTLDEWSKIIYEFVNRKALQNTVCTFYELIESKDNRNEKYYQIIIIIMKFTQFFNIIISNFFKVL
jgi:ESCRT-II complex subunit VPS25